MTRKCLNVKLFSEYTGSLVDSVIISCVNLKKSIQLMLGIIK